MFQTALTTIIICLLSVHVYAASPWSNCDTTAAIQIEDLQVPSPIEHPGLLNGYIQGRSQRDITGKITVVTKLYKVISLFGSFTQNVLIPCIQIPVQGNLSVPVGSCTYEDQCESLIEDIFGFSGFNCPAPFEYTCKCPFITIPSGTNIAHSFVIPIPSLDVANDPLTSQLLNGNFTLRVTANSDAASVGEVLCLDLKFEIRKKAN